MPFKQSWKSCLMAAFSLDLPLFWVALSLFSVLHFQNKPSPLVVVNFSEENFKLGTVADLQEGHYI